MSPSGDHLLSPVAEAKSSLNIYKYDCEVGTVVADQTGTGINREKRSLNHETINAPVLAKTVWKISGGSSMIKS